MSTQGRLVAEVIARETELVIRHLDNEGPGGGHYRITAPNRPGGCPVNLTVTLITLRRLIWDLQQEVTRAAQSGHPLP